MMFPVGRLPDLSAALLFQSIDHFALADLLPNLDWVFLAGGETLFRAGDAGDSMYVVMAGRLRIFAEGNNDTAVAIREIGRGESVGELALLTGKPRSATVRAIRDTELARLSRAAYEDILKKHPQLSTQLLVQIADRQSQGADRTLSKRNIRTIAVMPFDAKAATPQFVQMLVKTLREIGSTLHLSARSSLWAEPDGLGNNARGATVTQRLTEMESRHRFVVYEAEVDPSAWTAQCVRQADLILLLAAADSEPVESRHGALVHYFRGRDVTAAIELVLLHQSDFHPRVRAQQWLTRLPIQDYYHVVQASTPDFQRLSRFLTGSAVGLVLSGGGARGFAHIGILRALQECDIPVDFIGGTSMGAVIAAQHALGWDWRAMAKANRDEWPRCHPQRNFTLPLVALNSGTRMDRMLREMFGAAEIQNLRGKFFCVSTNLTRADAMIHRAGLLWKAVRASTSIPGIGPPAIERGEIFVDGGLVNNVPVDIMRSVCHGAVCAIDVSEQLEFKSKLQESYSVSGWSLLWRRLSPFATNPDLPNIFNILYRTTTVGSLRAVETVKAAADLYLSPPVSEFGIFDWRSIDKIIDAGYHYGLKIFAERGREVYSGAKSPESQ
ncbi:MAG: cyclic nucleotide-binding and patatin-like phospholipase domain-containing protein [Candidatus Binatia bacterium]